MISLQIYDPPRICIYVSLEGIHINTICPRSSDLFYIVSYYTKWVTTSWTHSNIQKFDGAEMVTQIMLRTHEGRKIFSEKLYPICDNS